MKRAVTAYFLANLAGAGLAFLLIPFLSRTLGPEDFGKAYIFVTLIWVFNTVVGLNLQAAVAVRLRKYGVEPVSRLLSSGLAIGALTSAALFGLSFVWGDAFGSLFSLDADHIRLALFGSLFNMLFLIWQSVQMIEGHVKTYAAQQVINAVLTTAATVILVGPVPLGLDGRLWGLVVGYVGMGAYSLLQMRRYGLLTSRVAADDLKDAVGYGWSLMPHMLGVFLFAGLDRILATRTLGEAVAGVYIGAAALAASVGLLTTALNRALVPRIYDTIKRDHRAASRFLRKTTALVLAAGLIASTVVWAGLSGVIEAFLGQGFEGAGPVFAVLVMCQFMFMGYTSASNVLLYFERNAALSVVTISTGAVVAGLAYALAPRIGVMGIAVALLIAWILRLCLTYIFAELQLRAPAAAPTRDPA